MSVADLLAHSRAAHALSFSHRGRIDAQGRLAEFPRLQDAGALIARALSARLDAHAADPEHTDPAWLDDQAANKGVSHDALVTFYGRYLTPADHLQPATAATLLAPADAVAQATEQADAPAVLVSASETVQ